VTFALSAPYKYSYLLTYLLLLNLRREKTTFLAKTFRALTMESKPLVPPPLPAPAARMYNV